MEQNNTEKDTNILSKNIKLFGIWLTFAAVIINAIVSFFSFQSAERIASQQVTITNNIALEQSRIEELRVINEKKQTESNINLANTSKIIKEKQLEISHKISDSDINIALRKINLSQLQFVERMLPNMLEGDLRSVRTHVALAQFALTPTQFEKLLKSMEDSNDEILIEVADQASQRLKQEAIIAGVEIIRLVEEISSETKSIRLGAMAKIRNNYMNDERIIYAVTSYLDDAREKRISISGRLNSVYLLRDIPRKLLHPVIINDIVEAIENMETGAENAEFGPKIGQVTRAVINDIEKRLENFPNNAQNAYCVLQSDGVQFCRSESFTFTIPLSQ